MISLTGKRCVVTGAGGGIGSAIVRRCLAAGAAVLATDRRDDALAPLAAAGAAVVVADLLDPLAPARIAAQADERIDVLILAAGVSQVADLADTTEVDFQRIMRINFHSAVELTRLLLPRMGTGAAIIPLVSELAVVAQPGFSAYCASKGALLGFARVLALEVATRGIRVNMLCPGPIDTPMLQQEFDVSGDPGPARREAESTVPIGRLGLPGEIADMAVFLASDAAPALLHGATILVDGGKTLR